MAEAEVDAAVIKQTQETLGKFIKKPPLTEKLLKKPPFRFLHDLFKAVIKDTGYFDGLYTADELNIENIKDRDDKMRFLQKMIDIVKLTTETALNVRTSKIVAGHEAERTNELLQLMGEIIEKEMDWQKAVKAVTGAGEADADAVVAGTGAVDGGKATANGTTKKDNSNNKDEKTKIKSKEKEKSQNNKIAANNKNKEIKTKEDQSKKSTPSPASDDKNAKRTIKMSGAPAAKEKATLSRQTTLEKVTKEKDKEKEKKDLAKKSKDSKAAAKIKDERKRTTLSPAKPMAAAKAATQNNEKDTTKTTTKKLENENKEKEKAENKENTIPTQSKEIPVEQQQQNGKVKPAAQPTQPIQVENGEPEPDEPRKTSATRKDASAGKSRRSSSSASKQKSIDNQGGSPTENEIPKPLKAVNESQIETQPQPQPPPPLQPQPQSQASQQPPKEIKREPTFTHENSRDSNSNSSSTQRPRTSLRPPSARPPSARPGAPRRRDRNVEIILQPNDQVKLNNINAKLEAFGNLDDDGENLVIIEDPTTSVENLTKAQNDLGKLEGDKLEQQGHLVQQILETQKELVQQTGDVGLKGEKESTDFGLDLNTRQSSARQMNKLRDIIQSLTKSVNPFGKLMDFIPEDIDAMQLELNMWRDNYTQAASDLKREKSLTESATEPMKNQLIQIEANIKEYLEMIDASRVTILQNSEKISKMLLEQ